MKYFSKFLSLFLVGAMLYATGCTDYDQDIKDLNNKVDELEQTLQGQIDPLKADLEAVQTALEAAIADGEALKAQHEEDVKALQDADAKAQKAIEEALKAMEAGDAELDKKIADAVAAIEAANGEIAKLQTVDAEIKENLKTLEDSLKTTQGDVESLKEIAQQLVAWSANVDGTLAAMNTEIEGINESIEALEGDVESLKIMIQQHDMWIQNAEGRLGNLEEYKAYADEQFELLAKADKDLNDLVANLQTDFADYQKIVNEQLTKAFAEIGENTAKINALTADLEAKYNELVAADKAMQDAIAQHEQWITNAEARINNLQEDMEEVQSNLEDLQADYDEFKEDVTTRLRNAEGSIGQLQVDVQGLNDKLNEFKAAYDEHIVAYNQFVENTNAALRTLGIDVDALMNRIQSIVYVPTSADHKADLVSLYYRNTLVSEGFVEMTFRVTPEAAAQQLVDYYMLQNDKEMPIFTLEPEEVETRAESASFTINSIRMDDENGNGRFIVNATPSLPAAYYEGDVSYSVALRLKKAYVTKNEEDETSKDNKANADLVSDYVNLNLVKKYTDGLVLVRNNEDGTQDVIKPMNYVSEFATYEIEYADMDARVTLLEGFEPYYVYDNVFCTGEDLAALGFNVADITTACTHKAYLKSNWYTACEKLEDANFAVDATTTEDGVVECKEVVRLASAEKAVKETIGNHLDSDHIYTIAEGADFRFMSLVKIVREHRDAELSDLWYKWNYNDYKATFLADPSVAYEGGSRYFALNVVSSNIPADIMVDNAKYVIDNWGKIAANLNVEAYTVAGEGETAVKTEFEGLNVTPIAYDAENKVWSLNLTGWEFNKAGEYYDIKATYSFDALDIVFHFNAEFINLIDIEYTHEKSVDFTYKVGLKYEGQLTDAENRPISVAEALAAKYPALLDVKDGEHGYFTDLKQLEEALETNDPEINYVSVRNEEVSTLNKTANYNLAVSSKPWTYLWMTKDDVLTGNVKIMNSDVKSDFDKFALTTSFAPKFENQTMKVTVNAFASVKMPDIYVVHVPYVVKSIDETIDGKNYKYSSDVVGLWDPNNLPESAVKSFTTKAVDLKSGFEVVHKNDKAPKGYVVLTDEELAALNIKLEFAIDGDYEGIKIRSDKNTLDYMGWAEFVPVNGTLMVNGIEKRGAFDAYNDAYKVNKFDPIKEFDVEEDVVVSTAIATELYVVNTVEHIQLYDVRGRELIDPNATDTAHPWVAGNDWNGFANGVNAGDVFSLGEVTYDYIVHDESGVAVNFLDNYLTHSNGVLTFSNLNNLKLQEDIFVTVEVSVKYPWSNDTMDSITYRVTSDPVVAE